MADLLPADRELELFDAACDTQLKFYDAPESYAFGQFVDLVVNFDGKLHTMTLNTSRTSAADSAPTAKVVEALQSSGFGNRLPQFDVTRLGASKPPAATAAAAKVKTISVDPDEFIASPFVSVKGTKVPLALAPESMLALLQGRPVSVDVSIAGKTKRFNLVKRRDADVAAATDHWVVDSPIDFLSHPVVPGQLGGTTRLTLDAHQVKSIRLGQVTTVEVGAKTVTLVPKSQAQVANTNPSQDLLRRPPIPRLTPSHASDVIVRDQAIQVSLFLPWEQVWTLLGYTRGRLIQSIGLAPQEETTIEVFDGIAPFGRSSRPQRRRPRDSARAPTRRVTQAASTRSCNPTRSSSCKVAGASKRPTITATC